MSKAATQTPEAKQRQREKRALREVEQANMDARVKREEHAMAVFSASQMTVRNEPALWPIYVIGSVFADLWLRESAAALMARARADAESRTGLKLPQDAAVT